jgi:cellulose synthase/poly-beta-1,6-N-acetylglucosamine synthase-like glycosyltransferase
MILFYYSTLVAIFWVTISIYLTVCSYKVRFLKDIHPNKFRNEPRVAVIIAVRNEEEELERSLKSVLELDYKNFRIITINDRSTDRTPEILENIKLNNPSMDLIHVKELPEGWLGKNHALYQGYLQSKEDWMLFTDADVTFSKDSLKRAMTYAINEGLDHLAVIPEVNSRSTLFNSTMDTFKIMLELRQRPWATRNPNSSASIGIGAFNLVKRTAYESIGTHSAISLRPDDDLKLGERIKRKGFRSDVLYGEKQITLEWYKSIREFINGLMKNTFSIFNYNLLKALLAAIATLLFFALPIPLMLFAGSEKERGLALIILLFQIPLFVFKRGMRGVWWHPLMIPYAGCIMVYILLKSTILTLKQRGIYWRDSYYPLSELKKNK